MNYHEIKLIKKKKWLQKPVQPFTKTWLTYIINKPTFVYIDTCIHNIKHMY